MARGRLEWDGAALPSAALLSAALLSAALLSAALLGLITNPGGRTSVNPHLDVDTPIQVVA